MPNWVGRVFGILVLVTIVLLANTQLLINAFVPPTVQYMNIPFPMDKDTYVSGDVLYVSVERCSTESATVPAVIARTLINIETGTSWPIPEGSVFIVPGCIKSINALANRLPDELPTGSYRIQGTVTVRGKFKTADVPWGTATFRYVNTREGRE